MIVFDASPLILLAETELLEKFLGDVPEPIVIPRAVHVECCENRTSFDALLIARLIREKEVAVRKLAGRTAFEQIRKEFSLGVGEAEAIALAQSGKARLIAIEDRSGVNACKVLKIPFIGALGILMRMKEKELITRDEARRKLEALANFGRYRADIVEDVRLRLEAKK